MKSRHGDLSLRILSGIGALGVRQILVMALYSATGLIVARWARPSEFSLYALALGIGSFLNRAGDAGLGLGMIRYEGHVPKAHLESLYYVTFLLSCAVTLIAGAGMATLTYAGVVPQATALVVVSGAGSLIANSPQAPATVVLERRVDFVRLGWVGLVEAVVFSAGAIVTATSELGALGYGGALTLRNSVGSMLLYTAAPLGLPRRAPIAYMRQYLGHGVRLQGSALVSAGKDIVRPVAVTAILSASAAGLVEWAALLAGLPAFLASAMQRVLLPGFGEALSQPGRAEEGLRRATIGVALVALPAIYAAAAALSPFILPILGEQWRAAETLTYVLMGSVALSVIAIPSVGFLSAIGRTKFILGCSLIWGAVPLILLTILGDWLGIHAFGVGVAASQVATVAVLIAAFRRAGVDLSVAWMPLLLVASLAPLLFWSRLGPGWRAAFLIAVAAPGLALAIAWISDRFDTVIWAISGLRDRSG